MIAVLSALPSVSIDFLAFGGNADYSLGQMKQSTGGAYAADSFVVDPATRGLVRITNNII
ncbi:MAG TPA: hypothetical protein VM532_17855 [Burkholderiales bacterium]|nr:hypothetical protein [Burkholderiales bacterium]